MALFWVVAAFRIQSYVTGQDPVTYLRLARSLLAEPLGSAAFRQALTEFAPGYPILLAVAIRVGGRFAPHWLNLLFAMGWVWVYAALLFRLGWDSRRVALALTLTTAFLLAGFAANPHFLLYPFRGTPAYFFAFLGLLLLAHFSSQCFRPWRMAGAAMTFLGATLVREPLIFAAVGGFLWLASQPPGTGKWKNLAAFSLPFVAVLMAGLLLGAAGGRALTLQFDGWLTLVRHALAGDALGHIGHVLRAQAEFFMDETTWSGPVLLALGLWSMARRRDKTVWMFFFPAVCLYFFYALFPYPHRRYFLSLLIFLCPVLSLGLCSLLDAAAARMPDRCFRRRIYGCAQLVLGVPLLLHVSMLSPYWISRVGRQDVLRFHDTLHAYAEPGDVIAIESDARGLWDVILSYSRYPVVSSPGDSANFLAAGRRVLFLQALDAEAFALSPYSGMNMMLGSLLAARFDLNRLEGDDLEIAGARFVVHEVSLRTQTTVRSALPLRPLPPRVVWLDLQDLGRTEPVRLCVEAPNGGSSSLAEGGGIHAILQGRSDGQRAPHAVLLAESETPLPAQPVVGVVKAGGPMDFTLLNHRSSSVHAWFRPPFLVAPTPEHSRYAAAMVSGGELCLPQVHGAARQLDVMMRISPSPNVAATAHVSYWLGDELLASQEIALERPLGHTGFSLLLEPGAPMPCIDVRVEPADCHGSVLRIRDIRFVLHGVED